MINYLIGFRCKGLLQFECQLYTNDQILKTIQAITKKYLVFRIYKSHITTIVNKKACHYNKWQALKLYILST
jgi:hypothetical protein